MKGRRIISVLITVAFVTVNLCLAQSTTVHAIVLKDQSVFKIQHKGSGRLQIKREVKILEEAGQNLAMPIIFHDRFIALKHFSAQLKDARGRVIEKYRPSDLVDESATPGGTLYDDSRVKYLDISATTYPYILSYDYEIAYDGLFSYPRWNPQGAYHLAVEHSSFEVQSPEGFNWRYKATFSDSLPEQSIHDGRVISRWDLYNLPALEKEPFSASISDLAPVLYLAPDEFEYDGHLGKMSTWDDFGTWLHSLMQQGSELDDPTRERLQHLVLGSKSPKDKVARLYQHLQKTTRYVSVQLGIGGYKPFPAQMVAEQGYGDCKALTNYMRVMLGEVGIDAYYTFIGAGKNHRSFTFEDFPNTFQANHVILMVPLEQDTIWLECTSQVNPFGYLGTFTTDRNALVVHAQGGQLIRTPSYSIDGRTMSSCTRAAVTPVGKLEGKVDWRYLGLSYDHIAHQLHRANEDQVKQKYQQLNYSGLEISQLNYKVNQVLPAVHEHLEFTISDYASESGDRLFINPNLFRRWSSVPSQDKNRHSDIVISHAIATADTSYLTVPLGFDMEALPKDELFETEFGTYQRSVTMAEDQILYTRQLTIPKGTYDKTHFPAFRAFLRKLSRADKAKIVLKKGT